MRNKTKHITCSNCKKAYSLNPQKIPPTLTAAKCKACGHSMPLKSVRPKKIPEKASVQPKKLPAKTNAYKITCLYCNRRYNFDRSKIPPDVSSVKCKACGHPIALKPADAQASAPVNNTHKITCLYCSKTYTIDRNKIPQGLTTTKCKSCGHAISLVPKNSAFSSSKKDSASTGAYLKTSPAKNLPQSVSSTQFQPITPLWRKTWLLAAVFAIVAIGIGVFYTGSYFLHSVGGGSSKQQPELSKLQFHATKLPKPFMRVHVNVPLALQTMDEHLPAEKKKGNYTKMVSALNSLKLEKIHLFLFQDSRKIVLPVAIVYSSKPQSLQTRIKKTVLIHLKLKRMPDGSYRLKRGVMPLDKKSKFPVDLYRIQFWSGGAVIAPKSFLPELQNPEILQQTLVAQMAASIETPGDLAVVSVRMPQKFRKQWENKIHTLPGVKENPQIAKAADIGKKILADMTGSFENIETLALGFHFNRKRQRNLRYAHIFRKDVDGATIYQQLDSGNIDDFGAEGILVDLLQLFHNPQYQQLIQFNDNKLVMEFTWSEIDDETFFSELSEVTIGQRNTQSKQPKLGKKTVASN